MTVREPEVQAGLRGMIEFTRRFVVAQPVPTILRKPEFVCFRMPVKPDGIAYSTGKVFQCRSVRLHAENRSIAWVVLGADITRSPDGYV